MTRRFIRHNKRRVEEQRTGLRFGLFPQNKKRRTTGGFRMIFQGKTAIFSLALLLIFSMAVANRIEKSASVPESTAGENQVLIFRSMDLLAEHFEKHGSEMGYREEEDYLAAANEVVQNPDALHKKEAEDGDDVYYLETSNDLVIVSTDGYIRTYFRPEDGIAYFNRL